MDALTGKTQNRKPLTELIAQEWAKPANCFTITQTVESDIVLDIEHPLVKGMALILGEKSYVGHDFRQGSLYKKVDNNQALIHRADIFHIKNEGGKSFPLIRRLESEKPNFALVVVHFGLPEGVRLQPQLNELYSGTVGCKVIANSETAALLKMGENDALTIFYPDGSVAKISYNDMRSRASFGGKLTIMDPEETFAARFARNNVIAGRVDGLPKATVQSEDYALHDLAAMIRLTKYYPEMLETITKEIAQRAKGVGLRPEVRRQLRHSLQSIGNRYDFWWLKDQSVGEIASHKQRRTGNVSPLRTGRETETADEKRAYEARRNARRAELLDAKNRVAKGPSGSTDPHAKHKRDKKK